MRSGYRAAIEMAEMLLARQEPDVVCARACVKYFNGDYIMPWFCEDRPLASGNEAERVLWLHYLISEGTCMPTGTLIAYRELPGAGFYQPKFTARVIAPLVKRFGANPSELCCVGGTVGGEISDYGDFSVVLWPLPRLPVTYILWKGDNEFPPEGNVLFDKTASGWLHPEDLTVMASFGTYRLISSPCG